MTVGHTGKLNILEPTAGKGAIVAVLRDWFPNAVIDSVELDGGRCKQLQDQGKSDHLHKGDFAEFEGYGYQYDLILTNPPFTIAIPVVERSILTHLRPGGLATFLMRQAILASEERVPFWRRHAAHEAILPKRPSFARSLKCGRKTVSKKPNPCGWKKIQEISLAWPTVCPGCGDKTTSTTSDSADYAWFVFGDGIGRTWEILELVE